MDKNLDRLSASEREYLELQAANTSEALAELERRSLPPVVLRWKEPGPRRDDGLPIDMGGVAVRCNRYVARSSGGKVLVFDRASNPLQSDYESLEAFERRVGTSLPKDGTFWLAIPEWDGADLVAAYGIPAATILPSVPTSTTYKTAEFAFALRELFVPAEFKTYAGGRGGCKSWQFARALILLSMLRKITVGCFREYMNSIKDSVHQVIRDQIGLLGLESYFEVVAAEIRCTSTGSVFKFAGVHHLTVQALRSTEYDVCWIEEAQRMSKESWDTFLPTVTRKHQCEVWISFNPEGEDDPTYMQFVKEPFPGAIFRWVHWIDNPWMPEVLNKVRLWMQERSPEAYEHVWNGRCKEVGPHIIFAGKYLVHAFEVPSDPKPEMYYGADWGFVDPTTLIACYITGPSEEEELWIPHEAWGIGVDLDAIPALFDRVPGVRDGKITADSSRPDMISGVAARGFRIEPTEKQKGDILDGIAHIRAFKRIHIHERCVHVAEEFRLYSWKRDSRTGQVIPDEPLDRDNHTVDALRYALQNYIRSARQSWKRMWARLAGYADYTDVR